MTTARTAAWVIPAVIFGPKTVLLTFALVALASLTVNTTLVVIRTEIRIWRWRRARAHGRPA